MDPEDDVGPGQVQQVRVAGEVPRVVAEPVAAVVLRPQAGALQHRAPGAVQHQDPLVEQVLIASALATVALLRH